MFQWNQFESKMQQTQTRHKFIVSQKYFWNIFAMLWQNISNLLHWDNSYIFHFVSIYICNIVYTFPGNIANLSHIYIFNILLWDIFNVLHLYITDIFSDLSNIDVCHILKTFKQILARIPKWIFMKYNNAISHIYCSDTF